MASLRLLVVSFCFLAACQARAPLVNTNQKSVVAGEYLVVLKAGSVGLASSANVNVLNSFNINGWRALHVSVESSMLAALRDDSNVELIEANTMEAHISCTEQDAGSEIWGLVRTSSRADNVDYDTEMYWIDADDGSGVDSYIVDTGINIAHWPYHPDSGMTGRIVLDDVADREPDYWITDMSPNGTFIRIAEVLNGDLGER
ncbi:hypothetical protein CAPTEDRAFT_210249, partial [Capitella teleta]